MKFKDSLFKFNTLQWQSKARLMFGVGWVSLIAVVAIATSAVLFNTLKKSEEQSSKRVVTDILGILRQNELNLRNDFLDWAIWDDTYQFMSDRNQPYIESNLIPEALSISQLNLILYVQPSGKILFGTGFDLEKKQITPIPKQIEPLISPQNSLLQHSDEGKPLVGIVSVGERIMIIASYPILPTDGQGVSRGSLIIGRYIDKELIKTIEEIARANIQIYSLQDKNLPAELKTVKDGIVKQGQGTIFVRTIDNNYVAGYVIVNDIYDQPAMLLQARIPREIYKRGLINQVYLIVALLLVGLIFGEIGRRLLERLILLSEERQNILATLEADLEEKRKEAEQIKLLAEIGRGSQEQEIKVLLNQFLDGVRQRLNVDRVLIYKFARESDGYIIAQNVLKQYPLAENTQIKEIFVTRELTAIYQQGQVLTDDDISHKWSEKKDLEILGKLAVKATLVVPIFTGNDLYGLLIAHHCEKHHIWQPEEIEQIELTASQIGASLSSVGLLQQREQEAQRDRQQKENIERELIRLLSEVENVSTGDLTVRAQITEGQIGIVADFFNAIVESLRNLVTQVKETTEQVNRALENNDTSMQTLAEQSLRQSKKIQRLLDFVKQMAESIEQVTNNAQSAAITARQASETAAMSEMAMDDTVNSILQLRSTVSETANKVKQLGEASQKIAKVIGIINEISLKTNVLAVNASIEAARAGEEGRGFAVVAQEVGQLAAQTAAATKDIEIMVKSIQQGTREVIKAMDMGRAQVIEGTQKVEKTKESLEAIVNSSRYIDELVEAISQATISQSKTSEMVRNLMQEIAQSSAQTAHSSENVSTSLKETVLIAEELQKSVEKFKIEADVNGKG